MGRECILIFADVYVLPTYGCVFLAFLKNKILKSVKVNLYKVLRLSNLNQLNLWLALERLTFKKASWNAKVIFTAKFISREIRRCW
jgi:hypothetical protein